MTSAVTICMESLRPFVLPLGWGLGAWAAPWLLVCIPMEPEKDISQGGQSRQLSGLGQRAPILVW